MNVQLLLNTGNPQRSVAPIQKGYYLLGRHSECQIRPRSSSVSRRHCLILHSDNAVGIMDLESKRGTTVNGEKLKPKEWRVLNHGDEVFCGKVSFIVVITADAVVKQDDVAKQAKGAAAASAQPSQPEPVHQGQPGVAARSAGSSATDAFDEVDVATEAAAESMAEKQAVLAKAPALAMVGSNHSGESVESAPPQSWQDIDLGALIGDDDDEPDSIGEDSDEATLIFDVDDDATGFMPETAQGKNAAKPSAAKPSAAEPHARVESDEDLSVYVDTPLDADEGATDVNLPSGTEDDPPPRAEKPKKTKPKKAPKIPKPKRPKAPKGPSRLPSFSLGELGSGAEKLKLIGALVAAIALTGFFGYQLKNMISGPQPRILKDLD